MFFIHVCRMISIKYDDDDDDDDYVIVRPLSTVEYTSVASLFHCRQWSD